MSRTALIVVFCLQAAPASSIEQRPDEALSLPACLTRGEQYASEWLTEHPKWRLSRWRCERNLPRQTPA